MCDKIILYGQSDVPFPLPPPLASRETMEEPDQRLCTVCFFHQQVLSELNFGLQKLPGESPQPLYSVSFFRNVSPICLNAIGQSEVEHNRSKPKYERRHPFVRPWTQTLIASPPVVGGGSNSCLLSILPCLSEVNTVKFNVLKFVDLLTF